MEEGNLDRRGAGTGERTRVGSVHGIILNDVQQEDCQYPGELADPPGDGASEVEGDEVRDGEADACTVDSTEKFNQSFRGTEDAIG